MEWNGSIELLEAHAQAQAQLISNESSSCHYVVVLNEPLSVYAGGSDSSHLLNLRKMVIAIVQSNVIFLP